MYAKKKLLLVMRHAKSDKSPLFLKDFDRPLNDRGKDQPKIIAQQLEEMHISIDKAIISPALRTKETWQLLMPHLQHPPKPIYEPQLYNASMPELFDVVFEHAQTSHHLLIIAHCPGVDGLTEYLCGTHHDFNTADLVIMSSTKNDLIKSLQESKGFYMEKILKA